MTQSQIDKIAKEIYQDYIGSLGFEYHELNDINKRKYQHFSAWHLKRVEKLVEGLKEIYSYRHKGNCSPVCHLIANDVLEEYNQ